jgi:hypothetical protein
MMKNRWQPDRHGPRSVGTSGLDGQAIVALPAREVLTTLFSTSMFPTLTQTAPVDQNTTGVTNTVGDTTTTTTDLANSTAQSAPAQTGATTQNVLSPGATQYASQTQYAPVTKL